MLFFKKILKEPDLGPEPGESAPAVERRSRQRFKVHPDSTLKAVLCFVSRDDTGAPMSHSRTGWNWKGRVLDCSEQGVRLQLGPVIKAAPGDEADLSLEIDDSQLSFPCRIANVGESPAGLIVGLKHEIMDPAAARGFRQLLEIVALGATLRRKIKRNRPDESGYLTEQYASERPARLTIWRDAEDRTPAAFEFLLKDSIVRGGTGHDLQYLAGSDATTAEVVPIEKAREMHRLFKWVVPNMSASVPDDVRKFLRHFAG